jgi:hypothetical protein
MEAVAVEQAPSGKWFVSFMGWGRRFETEDAARDYADNHHRSGA